MKIRLMLALLAMVMFAQVGLACSMHDESESQGMEDFSSAEWQGQYQAPEEPLNIVAQDASQWSSLWHMISREAPVELDTEHEMAVGIFLGLRRSGGYGVEIVSAKEEGEVFMVRYKEIEPGPADIVTMALTTPYLIRTLPKTHRMVMFKKVD